MNKNNLNTLVSAGISYKAEMSDFSFIFRFLNRKSLEKLESLENMSLEALLDVTHASEPSEINDIIIKDLGLKVFMTSDYVKVYFIVIKQLENFQKLFSAIAREHPIISKYDGLYNRVASSFDISPDVALLDSIAKRMSISWDQAKRIPAIQAYLMMLIDRRDACFQSELNRSFEKKK